MEELILNERKFKENLVELTNNSKLPAFVLKPIFKDMYDQLTILENQQYNTAKTKIEKEKKEKEDE